MFNTRKEKLFNYYLVLVCSIFVLLIGLSISLKTSGEINCYNEIYAEDYIESSQYHVSSPIIIDDSNPNYNWSKTALENAWCSGSGIWADPYLLEDIITNSSVSIENSNVYFKIMNCIFLTGGIDLDEVENGIIVGNQIHNGFGMDINRCNLTVVSGTFFNRSGGIDIWRSEDLVITGNTFDYIPFGIDAYKTNYSVISFNAFNGCSGNSIEFDDCVHNQLSNNLIKGSKDFGVEFNGDDNTISNNTITHNKEGLRISGNNNLIFNNTISENEEIGINCAYYNQGNDFVKNDVVNNVGWGVVPGHRDRFLENNVSFNYIGFYCFRVTNVLLKENIISRNRRIAIELIQCNSFNITNNLMYDCGFHLWDSEYDDSFEFLSHNISSNYVNDRNLYIYYNQTGLRANNFTNAGQIIMWYCNDSIIRGQNLSNGSRGITSLYGRNITIFNNDISVNNMEGIYINGGGSNYNISRNLLSFSGYGLKGYGLNSSSIINNTANGCTSGMELEIINSVISHNTMNNNKEAGLSLSGENNDISYNTANYNDDGFRLGGSDNNNFYENVANYNSYGLFMTSSSGNTITRNTFLSNQFDCIHGAEGNNVYNNICFSRSDLIFTRIGTLVYFGFAIVISSILLILSIRKVIKKRKRKLKLERN